MTGPLHAQIAARNAALAAAARREQQAAHATASARYWGRLQKHAGEVLDVAALDVLAQDMARLGCSVNDLAADAESLATIRRTRAEFDLGDLRARRDEARQLLVAARDRATKLRARADAATVAEVRADLRDDAAKLLTEADQRSAAAARAYDDAEQLHRKADMLAERLTDRGATGPDMALAFPPMHHAPPPQPQPVRAPAQEPTDDYAAAIAASMNAVRPAIPNTSNPRNRQ